MYVVIAGAGKVGQYLAVTLLKSGNDVAIIEHDRDVADRLSMTLQGRYLVICGDGCDSRFQEDAGVRNADVFVAATGQDDNNLVACEIAQRVFFVDRCVARVNNPRNMRIFQELGIESVSSTKLIAQLIEEETMSGSMSAVTSLAHGNVQMKELTMPRMKHHSSERGIRVSDIPMPPESVIIAASTSDDDASVVSPDTRLYPGDKVVIAADTEAMDAVRACFRAL